MAGLRRHPGATRRSLLDRHNRRFRGGVPFALAAFVLVLLLPELPLRDTSHVGGSLSELQRWLDAPLR